MHLISHCVKQFREDIQTDSQTEQNILQQPGELTFLLILLLNLLTYKLTKQKQS